MVAVVVPVLNIAAFFDATSFIFNREMSGKQSQRKKTRRQEERAAIATGCKETYHDFLENNPNRKNKMATARARGVEVSFQALVAPKLYLLAGWVTDGVLTDSENRFTLGVKMDETASMVFLVWETKKLVNNIQRFVCRRD